MSAIDRIPVTLAKEDAVKCNSCKCFYPPDDFSGKRVGRYTTCIRCREKGKERRAKYKCPHNKSKSKCKDCEGSEICIHSKQIYSCRECKPATSTTFCIHDKQKTSCRECKGSAFCIHDIQKTTCIECNPISTLRNNIRMRTIRAIPHLSTGFTADVIDDILGITMEEYMKYLEGTFQEGMSWDNYGNEAGTWQIDHIRPLNPSKNSEEVIMERLFYRNTQALWTTENRQKGCKESE